MPSIEHSQTRTFRDAATLVTHYYFHVIYKLVDKAVFIFVYFFAQKFL